MSIDNVGTDDDVFTTTTMITMERLNAGDKVYVSTKVRVTYIIYLTNNNSKINALSS